MKKLLLLQVILVLAIQVFNAQSITFVSERNSKPLSKVSVFGKNGNLLAQSDIDGKIDKQTLNPPQEKYEIVYNNMSVATLPYSDFEKDQIKVNDRVKDIQPVVISSKPAKYIYLKGYFNTYVVLNSKLTCYVDGVVTYIFDNKSKKIKNTDIQQYRVFRLINPEHDKKQVSTWEYKNFLKIPDIKDAVNIESSKNYYKTFKELDGDQKYEIEMHREFLQENEFSFFGFRLFNMKIIKNIVYKQGSQKTIKDLLECNEIHSCNVKHKTESAYNSVVAYKNFYPTEFSFNNDKGSENVKLDVDHSDYQTKFWQDPSFPNMQSIFSSYFKNDLIEKENKH